MQTEMGYAHARTFGVRLEEFLQIRDSGRDLFKVRLVALMGQASPGAREGALLRSPIRASEGLAFYRRLNQIGCFDGREYLVLDPDRRVVASCADREEADEVAARFTAWVTDVDLGAREKGGGGERRGSFEVVVASEVRKSGSAAVRGQVPSQSDSVHWCYRNDAEILVVDQASGRVVESRRARGEAECSARERDAQISSQERATLLEVVRGQLSMRYRTFLASYPGEEGDVAYVVDQREGRVLGVYGLREEAEDASLALNLGEEDAERGASGS